jgi:hypothetical protein
MRCSHSDMYASTDHSSCKPVTASLEMGISVVSEVQLKLQIHAVPDNSAPCPAGW